MKKAYANRSLLVGVMLLGLSACGGGEEIASSILPALLDNNGGNSGNVAPPDSNRSNSGDNNKGSNTTNSGVVTGVALTTSHNGATSPTRHLLRGKGYDALMMDGHVFPLVYPNMNSGNFNEINTTSAHSVVSGNWLRYSRFGTYSDKNTGLDYSFYVGHPTPTADMPKNGTLSYSGLATMSVNNGDTQKGDSSFRVDFDRKTIEGSVRVSGPDVVLRGNLNGNTFSGVHEGATMEGAFYGPQADELGGLYYGTRARYLGLTSDDVHGSFGATRH